MMKDNLKPCPFCGGEAERLTYPYQNKEVYVVMCKVCSSRSPMYEYDNREKAVKIWNTRAGKNV